MTTLTFNEAVKHYSKGDVKMSAQGNLIVGQISGQRKSGDGGRKTGQQLQFKCCPSDIFDLD